MLRLPLSSPAAAPGAVSSARPGRARRWRPIHFAAIVLGSAFVSWAAWKSGQPGWSGFDRLQWDFAFRVRGQVTPDKISRLPQTRDIVCVRTTHTLPRRLLARLVRKLSLARVVALDFMLVDNIADLKAEERPLYTPDIQRWKNDDALLASAIKSNGRVVLALWPEEAHASSLPRVQPATGATPALPDASSPEPASPESVSSEPTASAVTWKEPAPELSGAARGVGHVVITQEGGVLRRVPLWQQTRWGRVPCLGLAVAALARGQSAEQFESAHNWRLEDGAATIDWLGGRHIFEQLDNSIGYEQALEWEPEDFKDKIVLVGEVSRQSKEIVLTPWGEAPAMQAHATVAAMLLSPQGPPATPSSTWVLALCLGCSALVLAPLWRLGLWGCFASLLALSALTVVGSAWLFGARHVLLPGSAPIAAGAFSFNLLALYEYRRTRRTLSRFIGPEMISRALHPLSTLEPGEGEGQEEEATAFFCDLRGYSQLPETLSTRQTALLVNDYTTLLVRATYNCGGRVIDYQGDGIFVIFESLPDKLSWTTLATGSAPGSARNGARHATRAVRASLEVLREMREFSARWEPVVGREMTVGIGLQSGMIQIGLIGSSDRVHFGALGDAVNVASRVQEFSKTLPAPIILGEGTYQALEREGSLPSVLTELPDPNLSAPGEFEIIPFGSKSIRGRAGEVRVWGVCPHEAQKASD